MEKSFWGGFALLMLIMSVTDWLHGLVELSKYTLQHPQFQITSRFFFVFSREILRFLLTVSLAFLALQHLRNQATQIGMVFSFRLAWRPLTLIFLVVVLLTAILYFATNYFFHKIPDHLFASLLAHYGDRFDSVLKYLLRNFSEFSMSSFSFTKNDLFSTDLSYVAGTATSQFITSLGKHVYFALFALMFTYLVIGIFMAILLVLDKKIPFKNSVSITFKFINRHFVKKINLIILCFMLSAASVFVIFFSDLFHFVLLIILSNYILLVAFMAALLILDKKLAFKRSVSIAFKSINQHFVSNNVLTLLTTLGFAGISLIFLWINVISFWIGLIWLMPMVSLVTAIQYEQIFCEGKLTKKK